MKLFDMRLASALIAVSFITTGCSENVTSPAKVAQPVDASVATATKKQTPADWASKLNSVVKFEQRHMSDDGNTSGTADLGNGLKADYEKDGFRKLIHFGTARANLNTLSRDSTMSCYVALKENSKPTFFLVNSYVGENWLFMNKASIMVGGQVVFDQDLELDSEDRTTENGGVRERDDLPVLSSDLLSALKKAATSEEAVARLTGSAGYASIGKKRFATTQADLQACLAIYDKLDSELFETDSQ